MCEQARLALPAEGRAAGTARRFVAAQCLAWDLKAICDDVVLPVSELVANAVVHAGSAAMLTVSLSGDFLEIAVQDDSPREPIVRPVRADIAADIEVVLAREEDDLEDLHAPVWHVGEAGSIAAGRGLLIVDAIADEWGVRQLSDGKEVWFRLRARRPLDSACPCAGSDRFTPGGLPLRRR